MSSMTRPSDLTAGRGSFVGAHDNGRAGSRTGTPEHKAEIGMSLEFMDQGV